MLIWHKFKYGIFDVDGTLFDNIGLCADAFFEITKDFNFRETPEEARKIYLETNGMNLNDQFKLFFNNNKIKYDNALLSELNKKYFELRDNWDKWQNAPLFPETKSLLEILYKNGIRLFVSSGSNDDETSKRLQKAGILKYFDLVLGGEKIPKGQKHIDNIANFCALTPQKFASQAFFASDGPNDMNLAKKAGIFAIGITYTVSADELKSAGANITVKNAEKMTGNLNF